MRVCAAKSLLLTACVAAWVWLPGCTGNKDGDSTIIGGIVGGTAAIIAKAAGATDAEAAAAGVGVSAQSVANRPDDASALPAFRVLDFPLLDVQVREATQHELDRARVESTARLPFTPPDENAVAERNDSIYGVKVGQSRNFTDLVLLDPETGEPITELVYRVKTTDLASLGSWGHSGPEQHSPKRGSSVNKDAALLVAEPTEPKKHTFPRPTGPTPHTTSPPLQSCRIGEHRVILMLPRDTVARHSDNP